VPRACSCSTSPWPEWGRSILVIDGNVDALIRIAGRNYVIERGHITWSGTSRDLAATPRSSADISGLRQHEFG
jgi:ABC-type branched-subunit amino acid transport system ATPase component